MREFLSACYDYLGTITILSIIILVFIYEIVDVCKKK